MAKSKKLGNLADGFFTDAKSNEYEPEKQNTKDKSVVVSKPKYKGTYIYLTEEQKKRLAMYSVQHDTDNSAVIRNLIDEYIQT